MDNGASSYRRFLDGDDNGIVEIIRDYKDGLIFFLNRYVNNIHIAEELAEDTFFKLVTKKPRFTARYSFKTWLYTIGRNIAINYIKRANKVSNISFEQLNDRCDAEQLPENTYLQKEEMWTVYRALSKINSDYGQVLHLVFIEDMTNEQAAKIMKKNKRQIENLIYRAKQSLKAELKKEGFTYEEL